MAAVGYRFHPTDEELITHYLKLKMNGHDSLVDKVIGEVDVYRLEPSDLPSYSVMAPSDDQVWYFYCRLDYKYKNSKRANRATENGFWKVTGQPRSIVARETGDQIGIKKTLVFLYKTRGDAKPVKTDWVIHQYQATTVLPDQTEYVICKLKNKGDDWTKSSATASTSGEPSQHTSASDVENHGPSVQVGYSDTVVGNGPSVQPVLYIEEGLSMDDLLQDDVLFINDRSFDSDEEEVDPDSYLIIPDGYLSNETAYAHPNDYRPEMALSTYHFEDDVKEVNVISAEVPEAYPVFAGIPHGESSSRKFQLHVQPPTESQAKDKVVEGTTKQQTGAAEPGKEKLVPASERAEKRSIRVMNPRSILKMRSSTAYASGKAWKVGSSFIQMVELPESHMQSPPTVYIIHILIALLVLAFFICELPFLR